MTHVYAVVVEAEYNMPALSGEAYSTLEKAQAFIHQRADVPEQVSPFLYKGRQYTYKIMELAVR